MGIKPRRRQSESNDGLGVVPDERRQRWRTDMAMRGKAKVRYGVQCNIHGAENKLWAGRMVLVAKPQNKRQKMGGCPICNAEARREQAQDA